MESKTIIAATNNKGKLKEIMEILKDYKVISLEEAGYKIEVEEDQETFEGNSLKKAREIANITEQICISDDSGISIDILNGWPGVKTARFLGEDATHEQRNNNILEKMKNYKKEERVARVVTVISIVEPKGKEISERAEIVRIYC